MKFGLIANLNRAGADDAIDSFFAWTERGGHDVVVSRTLNRHLDRELKVVRFNEIAAEVDVIVAMGGDGTLLSSARAVGEKGTPILGINLGSLGFLTQQTPAQLDRALDAIVEKKYHIQERMLLEASVNGHEPLENPIALNDIVIDNGPVARVLDINLKVNGEDVVTYRADGLIIATPTGSTAYNLAVGGPIVHPAMEAMIASPIAAFSLTTRPMIIPGEDRLELTVLTPDRTAVLTLDGQVDVQVQSGQTVVINRADYHARFITFPDVSFYKTLRSKLHWGVVPKE